MSAPRLVVLRALGLGDYLTGIPAYRALARAFPAHERILAAPRWLGPLVEHEGSFARHVAVGPLEPLPAELRDADLAVNLHGRGPQSHRLLYAATPRRVIAFAHDEVPAIEGAPAWNDAEHEMSRWCRLLRAFGIAADPADLTLVRPPTPVPASLVGATVVHAGASSEARRWPPARWAEVARTRRQRGERVVLTGSEAERERANAIAREAGIPPRYVLAGQTGLVELAALIGSAACVASGDTGVAHLATALGTPSVTLFGPVSPEVWGPPAHLRRRHRALWAGRLGDTHANRAHDGLLALTPAMVNAALDGAATTSLVAR